MTTPILRPALWLTPLVLLTASCTDTPVSPSPLVPSSAHRDLNDNQGYCDTSMSGIDYGYYNVSHSGSQCAESGSNPAPPPIGTVDNSLYDAPGDPSPGSPGVFLGTGTTQTTCVVGPPGGFAAGDLDRDGMVDQCEFSIARSFAPQLHMHPSELCAAGEPAWATAPKNGEVWIAYMPAYYWDCGYENLGRYDAHTGDSEMIIVVVQFSPSTQHWVFRRMWTSAHYNEAHLGISTDYSEWSDTNIAFPVRTGAFPAVWVALDKHANYRSNGRCEGNSNAMERCGDSFLNRFPVRADRNAGGPRADFLGCALSEVSPETNRRECFYTPDPSGFRGWHGMQVGGTATAYWNVLQGMFYSSRDAGLI
ncbi:MAG TPA: hypothetical protein VFE05_04100 [Longimicrobiaceae bacterium]|nr:hypothetical protein [Longimicrobiaceae bacterium]